MSYLFKLALKNILRSKVRTVLTFLILSFGVGVYIFFASLMAGFDRESIINVIDFETGHYKVRSSTFDEDQPYDQDGYLARAGEVKARLRALGFVTAVTERLMFLAEIDNGRDGLPVVVIGIGKEDGTVFDLKRYVTDGGLEPGGAIIGKTLAEDLGLKLGELTYLTFRDRQGMYTSAEVLITGLAVTANPQVNRSSAFINLDEAQKLMNTQDVSEIALRTDAFFKVKEYEPRIKDAVKGAGVEVYSWERLSEDFRAMMSMKKRFQNILVLMIMIVAVVGIINTMLMSVFEKKREIGTMKALGFTDREVSRLFLIEGALIGVAGGLIGMVLGTAFNFYFAVYGFDMTAVFGDQDFGMSVMGKVRSAWLVEAYVTAMIFTLAASLLASYYPAKKVTKLEAMECLRTVQ